MQTGYLFMVGALLSFSAMGVTHKIGDRYRCQSLGVALCTMVAALLCSILRATAASPSWVTKIPLRAALLAIPFGICAALGIWLFQKGLRHGVIITSWLLINLSTAIPAALSVVIYHEPMSTRKTLTLLLIVCSLLLLWWDRKRLRQSALEMV